MKILVTGMAGFIGRHLAKKFSECLPDAILIGLDNLNEYYDVQLKYERLSTLGFEKMEIVPGKLIVSRTNKNIKFIQMDLQNGAQVKSLFKEEQFDYVINLAAQAGVRYSLINPQSYIDSNVTGFLNILEGCRAYPIKHLIYASSSSVYGLNEKIPFSEEDRVDSPASLYAATKKMNEAMAHTYAHLFQVPSSGLRFFTVYGEWGRPDMSPFLFVNKILSGKPIQLFNYGKMRRDFTYVDDIVQGIINLFPLAPQKNPPCEIYNIGNNTPIELEEYIRTIERVTKCKAKVEYLPMQAGDVVQTYADVNKLVQTANFKPDTPLEEGLKKFVSWYKKYYHIQ